MKTTFRSSFLHDLKKIKSKTLLGEVQEVIEQVEAATELHQIAKFKKMSGTSAFLSHSNRGLSWGVAVEDDVVEFVHAYPAEICTSSFLEVIACLFSWRENGGPVYQIDPAAFNNLFG